MEINNGGLPVSDRPFKQSDKVIYAKRVPGDELFCTPALREGAIYVVRDCLPLGDTWVIQLVGIAHKRSNTGFDFFVPANRFTLKKAA